MGKDKHAKGPNEDLIDLLLASDESARRLLVFTALQSGELKKSEADSVLAMVHRLERIAAPSVAATQAA